MGVKSTFNIVGLLLAGGSVGMTLTLFPVGAAAEPEQIPRGVREIQNAQQQPKHQISLKDAMVRIGEISPLIRQANERVKEAEAGIAGAESAVLPQITAQALWSNGNPGVFSVSGVDANFSAGSRLGEGLGLDLKQNIYDFGRSRHQVASEEARKTTEQTAVETRKAEAQAELLHVYANCSYLTSSVLTSDRIVGLTKMVARETNRFVKSGQRSIIERYLVDSQTEEVETRLAETKAKLKVVKKRLAQLLQLPATNETITCDSLDSLLVEAKQMKAVSSFNIFLEVENERLKQFEELQKFSRAEYLPKIFLEAQGGFFNADRADQNWNYGVGIGITVPLYSGHRIESSINLAQARFQFQKAVVARTTERVEQENFAYDEQIQSLEVRIAYLEKENLLAIKVFDLARNRYTKLQGSMIDLRDAIRELTRVLNEHDRAINQFAQALVQRSLWNEAFAR